MSNKKTPARYIRACRLSQVAASAEAARSAVAGTLGVAKGQKVRSGLISALEGAQEVLAHVRDEVFRETFEELHGHAPKAEQMPEAVHARKMAAGK